MIVSVTSLRRPLAWALTALIALGALLPAGLCWCIAADGRVAVVAACHDQGVVTCCHAAAGHAAATGETDRAHRDRDADSHRDGGCVDLAWSAWAASGEGDEPPLVPPVVIAAARLPAMPSLIVAVLPAPPACILPPSLAPPPDGTLPSPVAILI